MKKLYIYPNGLLEKEAKEWFNFRTGIDRHSWPGEVLVEQYNGKLVNHHDEPSHVLFENDSDYTFFMLRWA